MTRLLATLLLATLLPALPADPLKDAFQSPPHSAKPHTWFHIMSGNMSREGLSKDLEAIADAGIGGIILFNVTHNIPNGPVTFNSPEHIELTAFAAAECQRLGLSFGIHNCDGWTSSGGPWVPVEHSMKRVVHREIVVAGGELNLRLPSPTQRAGFYRDIAVIAYPALPSEIEQAARHATVTSSDPAFDTHIATNGKIDERSALNLSDDGKAWIQWDFASPFTVRSFHLNTEKQRPNRQYLLQSSHDGKTFVTEHELKIQRHGKYEYSIDHSFPPITARYFRFQTEVPMDLAEIELRATPSFEERNGHLNISRRDAAFLPELPEVASDSVVDPSKVRDLTAAVDAQGILRTRLPEGQWTIMRFGYTTTAAINDPASPEGTGWEVDKFSKEAFGVFWEGYVRNVIEAVKAVAPGSLHSVEIDSYEVGGQNWTAGYENHFRERLGYDITPFLPLYAGRFVESAAITEGVLWDIRRLNSDLMTENYFDAFAAHCQAEGIKSIVEPYGNGPFNQLDAARRADVPMGEFHASGRQMLDSAVSAGHIYGRNIIAAEAFTSGPQSNLEAHPGLWKPIGDKAWASGVNEFVFHTYAHQPNTQVAPGMTMSGFGAHINRQQTWWETAGKSWFRYVARGQYLLRQGVPISDLLVFVGDGAPNGIPTRKRLGNLPNSINYDAVNADVLLKRIAARDGKLVLPEGSRYHALVLQNSSTLTLPTLQRLEELSSQGILIVGPAPRQLGGYQVSAADQAHFDKLVSQIWSRPNTTTLSDWEQIYAAYQLPVDLLIENDPESYYLHRQTENEDIYFLFNSRDEARVLQCSFAIAGKTPQLWNPVTGEIESLDFETSQGISKVAVPLPASGSGFVVFRNAAATPRPVPVQETLLTLQGPWKVTFPALKEGPQTLVFDELIDWTASSLEGIKHYSGTATYDIGFTVSQDQIASAQRLELDLGEVNIAARVLLNGQDCGVAWSKPYALDITAAIRAGENQLRIEVVNQWANRLIGDEAFPNLSGYDLRPQIKAPLVVKNPQLSLINPYKMVDWYTANEPAKLGQRSTFITYPFFKKNAPLLPAGLLGPVKLIHTQTTN